jgi:hypothetical protein
MILTLDIFSGLPNPSWTLSVKDARKLINRLAGRAMAAPGAVESILGYRGFVIAATSDAEAMKAGLPNVFRIGDVRGTEQERGSGHLARLRLPLVSLAHEWFLGPQAGFHGRTEHGQSGPRHWRRAEPAEL